MNLTLYRRFTCTGASDMHARKCHSLSSCRSIFFVVVRTFVHLDEMSFCCLYFVMVFVVVAVAVVVVVAIVVCILLLSLGVCVCVSVMLPFRLCVAIII